MKINKILIPPSQLVLPARQENTPGLPGDVCEKSLRRDITEWASPKHKVGRDNPAALRSRRGLSRYPGLARVVSIVSAIVLMIFVDNNLLKGQASIYDYTGESILYLISPLGKAEYNYLGVVDLKGIKVNLVMFRTKVLLVEDTEKIYSDPESLLPYKIERTISKLWGKEYITEEYDQKKFTVVIRKFKGAKLVNEQIIKANGPIQNAILLPFYLCRLPDLKIGWQFTARVPDEFKLELVSIDEITVPAGKFQAYHLKSIPDKFEIWISKNSPRVPVKIQGKGSLDFALLMKEYSLRSN